MRIHVIGLIAAGLTWAQTSLDGPSSWYVYEPLSKSVRRAIGVPGAMHLQTVPLGAIDSASVAPDGSTVLFSREGSLFIADLSSRGNGVEQPLEGAEQALEQTVWAADSSAVVRASNSGAFQKVVRATDGWHVATAQVASVSGDSYRILAVGAGARLILATTGDKLHILREDADPLETSGSYVCATISKDGNSIFVTENTGAIRRLIGGSELVNFVSAAGEGIETSGLALSSGDRDLVVALRSARLIRIYDTRSGAMKMELPLDVPPSTLHRVSASAFLIAVPEAASDPFWLYSESPVPSTYFLPAGN